MCVDVFTGVREGACVRVPAVSVPYTRTHQANYPPLIKQAWPGPQAGRMWPEQHVSQASLIIKSNACLFINIQSRC